MILDFFSKYIAKEGKYPLFYSFLLFVITLFFIPSFFLKLLTFIIFIFFLYIYFTPLTKNELIEENAVYSLIDGQIVDIKETNDEKIVKIYKSLLDNSAIKSPFDSKVEKIDKIHGAFLKLSSLKSKKLNERMRFLLKSKKIDIKISAICDNKGIFGFDIYKNEGIDTKFGENIGYASNALFEITFPKNVELKVKVGDQVVGGISILGYVKEEVE